MTILKRNAALLSGLLLILLSNIAVLANVAYNRAGEPVSVLKLTERELTLPNRRTFNKENSGTSLSFRWRADYRQRRYGTYQNSPWLDQAKLESLGFDLSRVSNEKKNANPSILEKQVFLVLEMDGDSYQERLRHLREEVDRDKEELKANPGDTRIKESLSNAEDLLTYEVESASRLYVIDAGLNADELLEKYTDQEKYAVVSGRVKPVISYPNQSEPEIRGYIRGLMIPTVNVPFKLKTSLEPVVQQGRVSDGGPRYEATIAYGRTMEPWVTDIRVLDSEDALDQ